MSDTQGTETVIETIKARFASIRCSRVEQMINTMANPVRFYILCALSQQPFTVSELVELSSSTLSNVSQQLKMMWVAGYLDKERQGKQIYYQLRDERIAKIISYLETLFPPEVDGCLDPDE